jgi:EAL domain-containing protein (putative c-di-GMP-specific phosphodiesterase class I)
VDARTLERVCERLAADRDARIAWRIAPEALRSMRFLSVVAAHLGARPGIESRLIVDVPAEALGESRSRGRLDALKALGVATMLSPFGQGRLPERQLRALPLDVLRIDPRLVQTVGRSPDDRLVLRRLIDKAQHLGMATLADGVPDEAALRLLSGFGADYLQGPAVGPAVRPIRDREAGRRTTRVA